MCDCVCLFGVRVCRVVCHCMFYVVHVFICLFGRCWYMVLFLVYLCVCVFTCFCVSLSVYVWVRVGGFVDL